MTCIVFESSKIKRELLWDYITTKYFAQKGVNISTNNKLM